MNASYIDMPNVEQHPAPTAPLVYPCLYSNLPPPYSPPPVSAPVKKTKRYSNHVIAEEMAHLHNRVSNLEDRVSNQEDRSENTGICIAGALCCIATACSAAMCGM